LVLGAALAQAQISSIEGTVTDTDGSAIAHAYILIHWDSSGSAVGLTTNVGIPYDLKTETDKDGKFQIQMPDGFYDVFVSANAFSPHTGKVRVKLGRRVIMNPRLLADPLVTKELGDRFPAK